MRHIRLTVEDEEFDRLEAVKGEDRTWRDAMLEEFGVAESDPAAVDDADGAGAITDQEESV